MKKFISIVLATTVSLSVLTACSSNDTANTDTNTETDATEPATEESKEPVEEVKVIKVGMTTDSGTIDDKSFNQGTWEGIKAYQGDNDNVEINYVQPIGEAEQDYLNAFRDLVDAGYEMIISPGYKFEKAVNKAQDEFPDVKFVILDGYPHSGDYTPNISANTESIFFAEHESGFYAGVTAALNSKTGNVSFIGGMEIPAVQKFGWGYVAGVAYANENYGTNVVVSDYIYQGTFTDVAAGKTFAGNFYDKGSDIVFAAAGGVGVGVIEEGKTRRSSGEDIWVIGVDVDQYADGVMADGTSVILTSAMKDLATASYDAIDEYAKGTFKGGQMITLNSSNHGVGLPSENPNMSDESKSVYEELYPKVASGDIIVPDTLEALEAFLGDHGYNTPSGLVY